MMMTRISAVAIRLALALVFLALPALHARASVEIQEVRGQSGVTAWLVEDYTVPIVTLRFAFRGGSAQEPEGMEGLANLMSGLFDEGAGELDSDAFQIALDEAGAEMSFDSGSDAVYGSMRSLEESFGEAADLLRLAIQAPRFDEAPVARIRAQIISNIEAMARDPRTLGRNEWARAIYGNHPYARDDEGTAETLNMITPADLADFHRRLFARDNLVVAAVGAISPERLAEALDHLFGELPETADLAEIGPAEPRFDQQIRVDFPLPQTRIQLAYPGVARDDPEFFAAFMMNHILGGGTFSSRLFTEVRDRRGLAYGVSSGLITRRYASGLMISTQTRSDRAPETLEVIRETVRAMAEEGPTEAELESAKRFVIGAYAINNLDSSSSIARTLVELQVQDLGIDYIERRVEKIEAVTVEEVRAAARTMLEAEPAVMLVGPAPAEVE